MEHKSDPAWKYNLMVEGDFRTVVIDLGNSPGWEDKYRDQLDNAERISIMAKPGEEMPFATVELDGDKRWIFFSKVCGRVNVPTRTGAAIRLYCIGWQRTIEGTNVKSLTWIYPNGMMENGPNPMFTHHFLNQILGQ